jgi:hypothetical protein
MEEKKDQIECIWQELKTLASQREKLGGKMLPLYRQMAMLKRQIAELEKQDIELALTENAKKNNLNSPEKQNEYKTNESAKENFKNFVAYHLYEILPLIIEVDFNTSKESFTHEVKNYHTKEKIFLSTQKNFTLSLYIWDLLFDHIKEDFKNHQRISAEITIQTRELIKVDLVRTKKTREDFNEII